MTEEDPFLRARHESERITNEVNDEIDRMNMESDARHRKLERELGYPIPKTPHTPPHVPSVPHTPRCAGRLTVGHSREEQDPFTALEPGSTEARSYAREEGSSGWPRWMEPFSKVDVLGHPTVFSDNFDPLRGSRR